MVHCLPAQWEVEAEAEAEAEALWNHLPEALTRPWRWTP